MNGLAARGAECITLSCTKIEMLVKPEYQVLPLYDTTLLHARHAVEWALSGGCQFLIVAGRGCASVVTVFQWAWPASVWRP